MNFLAHIFLSGNEQEIQIGNFIGDFVKGKEMNTYPDGIRKGIYIHRAIDHFTDHHPVVKESKQKLWDKYSHYAAVIVDVYYDHFLAADFDTIAGQPLKDFTTHFYQMIHEQKQWLPENVQRMLFFMEKDNWLFHYRTVEGIDRALTGISRRTKFRSGMEKASVDLEAHYESFHNDFNRFFPDLQAHVNQMLADS